MKIKMVNAQNYMAALHGGDEALFMEGQETLAIEWALRGGGLAELVSLLREHSLAPLEEDGRAVPESR